MLSSETQFVKVACTGAYDYTFDFKIFQESELDVYRIDATGTSYTKLTLNSDYTVAGTNGVFETGGTVTTVLSYSDGWLFIRRHIVPHQELDLPTAGPLPSAAIEEMLDKFVMMVQRLEMDVENAVRAPQVDGSSLDMNLPALEERKGGYLYFDGTSGEPRASTVISGTPVSAYMAGLLDSADSEEFQTDAGLFGGQDIFELFLTEFLAQSKVVLRGLDVTKGSGNTLDYSAGSFMIKLADGSYVYRKVPSLTDETPSGMVSDDVTTNYVKIGDDGADGYTITVDDNAPTAYELELARFVTSSSDIPATLDITERDAVVEPPTREMYFSTSDPTADDGKDGDLWFVKET